MISLTKEKTKALFFFAAGILCLVFAGLLITTFSGRWEAGRPTVVAGPLPVARVEKEPQPMEQQPVEEKDEWVVYITGCVQKPGVYHVPADSRVYQVVDMAGGFSSLADHEAINLATPLQDGMHIHVPARGEVPKEDVQTKGTSSVSLNGAVASRAEERDINRKIDINSASEEQLQALPGVGPKTAASIVSYRESQGDFEVVEDLLRVRGIGPAKFEKIRQLVTIGS